MRKHPLPSLLSKQRLGVPSCHPMGCLFLCHQSPPGANPGCPDAGHLQGVPYGRSHPEQEEAHAAAGPSPPCPAPPRIVTADAIVKKKGPVGVERTLVPAEAFPEEAQRVPLMHLHITCGTRPGHGSRRPGYKGSSGFQGTVTNQAAGLAQVLSSQL